MPLSSVQASRSVRAGSTPTSNDVGSSTRVRMSLTREHSSPGDSSGKSSASLSSSSHNVSSSSSSGTHSSLGPSSSSSGSGGGGGGSFGQSASSEGLSGGSVASAGGGEEGGGDTSKEAQSGDEGNGSQEKGEDSSVQQDDASVEVLAERGRGKEETVKLSLPVNMQLESSASLSLLGNPVQQLQSLSKGGTSHNMTEDDHLCLDSKLAEKVDAQHHIDPMETIEESIPMSPVIQSLESEPEKTQGSSCDLHSPARDPGSEQSKSTTGKEDEVEGSDGGVTPTPGSPGLLEDEEDRVEGMEDASPEVVLQAPMTPVKQLVASAPKLPPESSKGDFDSCLSEKVEVDFSTQSSFALQLSQSQSLATPISMIPSLTGGSPLRSVRNASPMKSLLEIEEHEKEFVNLREKSGFVELCPERTVAPGQKSNPGDDECNEDKMADSHQRATALPCADEVDGAGHDPGSGNQPLPGVEQAEVAEEMTAEESEEIPLQIPGIALVANDSVGVVRSEQGTVNTQSENNRHSMMSDTARPSIVIARVISSSRGLVPSTNRQEPVPKATDMPTVEDGSSGVVDAGVQTRGGLVGCAGISVSACGSIVGSEVGDGGSLENSLEQLTSSGNHGL